MSIFNTWQPGAATLMALAITTGTTVPLFTTTPASAQLFPQQSTQLAIPSGTSIPVRYEEGKKIVVSPKETMSITLTVAADIVNRSGRVLIPAGSQIIGQLQPATGGSQFVGRELAINQGRYQDRRQAIDATSRVINQTQVSRGANTGNILKGAVAGAAAAAALEGLTGNRKIGVGDILIGTGVGAAGGAVLGRTKADVVVINPDTDLDLTLRSSLALR